MWPGAGLAVEDAQLLSHCLQRRFGTDFPMELFHSPQDFGTSGAAGSSNAGSSNSSASGRSSSSSTSNDLNSSSNKSTSDNNRVIRYGIYDAINTLDKTRMPRINRLRQFSDVAQTMVCMYLLHCMCTTWYFCRLLLILITLFSPYPTQSLVLLTLTFNSKPLSLFPPSPPLPDPSL